MSMTRPQNEEVAKHGNEGTAEEGVDSSTAPVVHETGWGGMAAGLNVLGWLVAGIMMQGVALVIAVGTSFEEGSHRVAFKWFFPLPMLCIDKNGSLGPVPSLFLLVQFAIYGAIMAVGSATGYTRWFLIGLVALHVVLAGICLVATPVMSP